MKQPNWNIDLIASNLHNSNSEHKKQPLSNFWQIHVSLKNIKSQQTIWFWLKFQKLSFFARFCDARRQFNFLYHLTLHFNTIKTSILMQWSKNAAVASFEKFESSACILVDYLIFTKCYRLMQYGFVWKRPVARRQNEIKTNRKKVEKKPTDNQLIHNILRRRCLKRW